MLQFLSFLRCFPVAAFIFVFVFFFLPILLFCLRNFSCACERVYSCWIISALKSPGREWGEHKLMHYSVWDRGTDFIDSSNNAAQAPARMNAVEPKFIRKKRITKTEFEKSKFCSWLGADFSFFVAAFSTIYRKDYIRDMFALLSLLLTISSTLEITWTAWELNVPNVESFSKSKTKIWEQQQQQRAFSNPIFSGKLQRRACVYVYINFFWWFISIYSRSHTIVAPNHKILIRKKAYILNSGLM